MSIINKKKYYNSKVSELAVFHSLAIEEFAEAFSPSFRARQKNARIIIYRNTPCHSIIRL